MFFMISSLNFLKIVINLRNNKPIKKKNQNKNILLIKIFMLKRINKTRIKSNKKKIKRIIQMEHKQRFCKLQKKTLLN